MLNLRQLFVAVCVAWLMQLPHQQVLADDDIELLGDDWDGGDGFLYSEEEEKIPLEQEDFNADDLLSLVAKAIKRLAFAELKACRVHSNHLDEYEEKHRNPYRVPSYIKHIYDIAKRKISSANKSFKQLAKDIDRVEYTEDIDDILTQITDTSKACKTAVMQAIHDMSVQQNQKQRPRSRFAKARQKISGVRDRFSKKRAERKHRSLERKDRRSKSRLEGEDKKKTGFRWWPFGGGSKKQESTSASDEEADDTETVDLPPEPKASADRRRAKNIAHEAARKRRVD